MYNEKKRSKFLGLPLSFTRYMIDEEKLTIRRGFFKTIEDDAMMYKIQDVRLTRTLWEKVCGVGTVVCYTGDTTHPELQLVRVKKSREIKDFILNASEEARRKRRTLHSLDIDVEDIDVD